MSDAEQVERLRRAWVAPSGWRYWSSVNNNEVGLWYVLTAFAYFLFAGVLALLMRTQLAVPGNDFLSPEIYNQAFTLHGSVMMFLFAVPIFEAFSIILLPPLTGARELPFPRLSAFGYWCFLLGGVFVCGSILWNVAPAGGWTMYPPLATRHHPGIGADIWLLGLSFIEVSSIAAAVELIVGVLRCRAPGMRIDLMPLYAWFLLVAAVLILFAFPPLIAGGLLFELERAFDWPFFDAARGGNPLLWQHLFWIFGHPEVYIIFLPAAGIVAMIVPTFARRPVVGYTWIVLAAAGTGFLSFGLWVHHMYATGLPVPSLAFFSAASEAVAIPTGIQIFCLIGTVLAGRYVASVPMLFVTGALAIFVLGGLTGVMVAIAPFDLQVHDTYFIVAHLHYALVGGMLFPVLAAVHYYFPLVSGRSLSPRLGRLSFWLMFGGFNLAFLPMHLTGIFGMPRRVYTYAQGQGFDALNLISTAGAFLLAAGVAALLFDLVRAAMAGARVPRNPWQAGTLEWLSPLPTESWAPRVIPRVTTRYPLWEQPGFVEGNDAARGYLADAPEGLRETLLTSAIDATPQQVLRVPGHSFLPMLAAFALGGVFIFPTFHAWWWTLLSALLVLALIMAWLWTATAKVPSAPAKDAGDGLVLPLYASGPHAAGWWGMFAAMVADAGAFASLVFANFFYWTTSVQFPPAGAAAPGLAWPVAATAALLAAAGLCVAARRCLRRPALACGVLALAAAASLVAACAWAAGPWRAGLAPVAHAYGAMVWALVVWVDAHLILGTIMLGYCIARVARRRLTATHDADLANVTLYWAFVAATGLVTFAVLALFPLAAGAAP